MPWQTLSPPRLSSRSASLHQTPPSSWLLSAPLILLRLTLQGATDGHVFILDVVPWLNNTDRIIKGPIPSYFYSRLSPHTDSAFGLGLFYLSARITSMSFSSTGLLLAVGTWDGAAHLYRDRSSSSLSLNEAGTWEESKEVTLRSKVTAKEQYSAQDLLVVGSNWARIVSLSQSPDLERSLSLDDVGRGLVRAVVGGKVVSQIERSLFVVFPSTKVSTSFGTTQEAKLWAALIQMKE